MRAAQAFVPHGQFGVCRHIPVDKVDKSVVSCDNMVFEFNG